jgi:hypothetical protein
MASSSDDWSASQPRASEQVGAAHFRRHDGVLGRNLMPHVQAGVRSCRRNGHVECSWCRLVETGWASSHNTPDVVCKKEVATADVSVPRNNDPQTPASAIHQQPCVPNTRLHEHLSSASLPAYLLQVHNSCTGLSLYAQGLPA